MRTRKHIFGVVVALLVLSGCRSWLTTGPEPPEPSVCECPELSTYVAGLPIIGEYFEDAEIQLQFGTVEVPGRLKVAGTPVGTDPEFRELIEALNEAIPDATAISPDQVGKPPDWRLVLNPRIDSPLGSVFWFESIDGVDDFAGYHEPDTHDPEGIAAIQADAIALLADLEAALTLLAGQ